MTAEEFTWLLAYSRVEPFGFEMENFRAGIVASTVAGVHGHRKSPKDFYPQIGQPVRVDGQSQEEQMMILLRAGSSNKPS